MNQEMRSEAIQSSVNGSQVPITSTSPQKNGFSSSSANGHSSSHDPLEDYTNGFNPSAVEARSEDFYGHDREEVTRLLIQGLGDLGYESSARRLSQESGYEVESPAVAAFRQAVLRGDWAEAESLLFKQGSKQMVAPDGGGVSIRKSTIHGSQRLAFNEDADRDYLKFIIREQKYLELLERRDTTGALMVLQGELQPLRPALWEKNRLNNLSE